ncbi:MAG: MBL fold metallo-hydrolase, partial [Oscillospiraceae bacterium]
DKIVLTHGHFDHILALPVLLKTTKAPLYIHENGKIFLEESEYNLAFHLDVDWKPITADHYLKDGDVISLGDKSIKVIHTPGHTSDCICLLVDDILISGDTLFQGSVGRIDHPTGDLSMEVNSIKQKLMPLSDDIKVYPGHGNDTTIGSERRENPYLR